ncbi:hypothetical protein [Geomonas subterranea]|uniref:Secreted protein n=1 Tax=Geomonas subterranea TaxID=2847989 RepID=A0ABX8LIP8_9BACT|nr:MULTISPECIES: hypothetical protein [Geomonas]QXE91893.1 hypothetical protein KP001_04975 [Geomonas subterranea]QXM10016.1 hypothetical protein KP002_02520 [Geomonas subterranea]
MERSTSKINLLALVLAVAVFFVSQGIIVPNPCDTPLLSAKHLTQSSHDACLLHSAKGSQSTKTAHAFPLAVLAEAPPKVPVILGSHTVSSLATLAFTSADRSTSPARAPPA